MFWAVYSETFFQLQSSVDFFTLDFLILLDLFLQIKSAASPKTLVVEWLIFKAITAEVGGSNPSLVGIVCSHENKITSSYDSNCPASRLRAICPIFVGLCVRSW